MIDSKTIELDKAGVSDKISVLVVDDSALMRKLISTMINETNGMYTIATAGNGKIALDKLTKLKPDIIILDIEMPEMNGIEFLRERQKQKIRIPVIILSSVAIKGSAITAEALSLGASDFILKPSGSISLDIATVKDRLTELIYAYGGRYKSLNSIGIPIGHFHHHLFTGGEESRWEHKAPDEPAEAESSETKKITPVRGHGKIEIVALGISTGGPEAMRVVLAKLYPDLGVPMVVVQHMPAGFTAEFARSLGKCCPLEVKEAQDGEELRPNHVYIAEGSKHLEVEKVLGRGYARLIDTPLVCGHKPSVDVLFASVALQYQNHALGVIMTGMGKDGAAQLGSIYREGGLTLGQDEASSIVYGMPRIAWEMGYVMEQVNLNDMGERISQVVKSGLVAS